MIKWIVVARKEIYTARWVRTKSRMWIPAMQIFGGDRYQTFPSKEYAKRAIEAIREADSLQHWIIYAEEFDDSIRVIK